MKKIVSKISILAIAGAMMTTVMTGCGKNKESSAEVSETTTSVAETTATTETTTTATETETTTVAETTEKVTETTTLSAEDEWLNEWKNSDDYITGLSDIRENMDNLYAVHLLFGGDAIKSYENGTFDGITDGYDLMWKFGDEQYYSRDFEKNQNFTIKPDYDCSLDAEADVDVSYEVVSDLFWNKTTNRIFGEVKKQNKYDPFENGNAEYKDNTVCLVWQKEEGTFDGAEAFYYEVKQLNYDTMTEIFSTFENPDYSGHCRSQTFTLRDDIADMFSVTSTDNSAVEDTSVEETTAEQETTTESIEETTKE